jgi:hypothetical protein
VNTCLITPKRNIFAHHLMDDYPGWTPRYVRGNELQEELTELEKEHHRSRNLYATRQEYLTILHSFLKDSRKAKVEALSRWLQDCRGGRNPFEFPRCMGQMGTVNHATAPLPDWDMVTEAVALLEEGISQKERSKQLSRLDEKIVLGKAELSECQPPERYLIDKAKVIVDAWDAFVQRWIQLQRTVNAPLGPQGITLTQSPREEKEAWKVLGLADYVSKNSRYAPHLGDREEKSQ